MNSLEEAQGGAHTVKCELAGEVLASSGTLRLRATDWSMLPTVWPGDVLLIERANSEVVSEADIVLFGRDRRLFVHRVVRKIPEDSKIPTRGDAMPRLDPPVVEGDLMGKSERAARVIVGAHGILQSLLLQNSNH